MREVLLQSIWAKGLTEDRRFITLRGHEVVLLDQGELNNGDGPDFLGARVLTEDGITLHGDIEIHTEESEWFAHKHHENPKYNSVILHVVLYTSQKRVHTLDGYTPDTLCMLPYIEFSAFNELSKTGTWPCSGHIHHISPAIITRQFEEARQQYFESKTAQMMTYYDSSLPLSEAWKKMLCIAYGYGLGISGNSDPMARLASYIYEEFQAGISLEALTEKAKEASGLASDKKPSLFKRTDWSLKNARPGNKPTDRIPELSYFMYQLDQLNPRDHRNNPQKSWKFLLQKKHKRNHLLYHITYLPCLYILGDLLFDHKIKTFAYEAWQSHTFVKDSWLIKEFKNAGFGATAIPNHLGSVYQYKHKCSLRRCEGCEIFKAIRA